MIIPTEIVATLLGVLLTAVIAGQISLRRKIERLERSVLTIMVMLRDRGLKIPDASDTERVFKKLSEGI